MHCHSRIPLISVVSSTARHYAGRGLANRRAFVFVLATVSLVSFLHTPARAQTACSTGLAAPPNTLLSLAQCCAKNPSDKATCLYVDTNNEFVIVKDNDQKKPNAYLIIPIPTTATPTVTGIEDKHIFDKPFVNFWDYGWTEHWL